MNKTGPDIKYISSREINRLYHAPPSSFTATTTHHTKSSHKQQSQLASKKAVEEGSKLSSHFTAPSERRPGDSSTQCNSMSSSMCSRLQRVEKQLVEEHEQQRVTQAELAKASRELRLLREVLQRREGLTLPPAVAGAVAETQSRITTSTSPGKKSSILGSHRSTVRPPSLPKIGKE